MTQRIEVDAANSRALLKSIRYGMATSLDAGRKTSEDASIVDQRIARLKKEYLELRPQIDEKSAPIGNIIFYAILKRRYADFHYEFDPCQGKLVSNLHRFKVNGKPPSMR